MNKVILIGRLTKDPELSNSKDGMAITKFTLAVQRRFKQDETDFLNIVTFKTSAENCQKYLKKGSKCAVIGSVQTRSYEAQDGSKRYVTEIIADEVEFLSAKNEEEQSELQPINDNTLPF